LNLKCDIGKLSNLEAESLHKGLQLGDYRPPDKDEILKNYNKRREELLSRQEELRRLENIGDGNWLNHMQSIDKWNWCWINDTRQDKLSKDYSELYRQKKIAEDQTNKRKQLQMQERENDCNMINNLIENEKQQNQRKNEMKNAQKSQLKEELLKQMKDKEKKSVKEEKSVNGNSLGINLKFGYSNIDQKAIIHARNQKKEK